MPTKTVKVKIEVPDGVSDEAREGAERHAHEAAVLTLFKEGAISTRQAAAELGLTYYDFLDLLSARGIPVERGPLNTEALEEARRRLAGKES
jgi:predicted HTH domain antitoxin